MDGTATIKIMDMVGRVLKQEVANSRKGFNQHELLLNRYQRGNYILTIATNQKTELAKFRIE